jgi:2'-5' RNA ligase
LRLFVALDLPDETRHAICEAMHALQSLFRADPKSSPVRWARPEGMHVTLKFIGHVGDPADPSDEQNILSSICTALSKVHSPRPVEMNFRGMGFFPDTRRPRVMWCGVEASPNFASLAADIDRSLEPLGIAENEKAAVPHITLARFKPPNRAVASLTQATADLLRAAEEINSTSFGASSASEFHLFESFLKPSGAEYKCVRTFRFVEPAA